MTRRSDRRSASARPLRRKPKQLDEEPTLFEALVGGSGGAALPSVGAGRGATDGPTQIPGGDTGYTDDEGRLLSEAPDDATPDLAVLRRARQIAAQLSVPRPRAQRAGARGVGVLASVRYRGASDDIDIDATVARLVEHPVPEEDDIVVREPVRTKRSVVLLVDVSGSMRGERVRTAAATVGALAGELTRDELAVVAFWSDAAVLSRLGRRVDPFQLLEAMLRIPARGLTNVGFPLQVAARELARAPSRDARVVLLSDCVHNAGADPRPLAARLPRLDVLFDTSGEQDAELAHDLARLGRGRLRRIRTYRDVAPALSDCLAR